MFLSLRLAFNAKIQCALKEGVIQKQRSNFESDNLVAKYNCLEDLGINLSFKVSYLCRPHVLRLPREPFQGRKALGNLKTVGIFNISKLPPDCDPSSGTSSYNVRLLKAPTLPLPEAPKVFPRSKEVPRKAQNLGRGVGNFKHLQLMSSSPPFYDCGVVQQDLGQCILHFKCADIKCFIISRKYFTHCDVVDRVMG